MYWWRDDTNQYMTEYALLTDFLTALVLEISEAEKNHIFATINDLRMELRVSENTET